MFLLFHPGIPPLGVYPVITFAYKWKQVCKMFALFGIAKDWEKLKYPIKIWFTTVSHCIAVDCWSKYYVLYFVNYVLYSIPGGSDGKESACNERDLSLILGLGKSPGGGHGNPFQYSCLKKPHGQRSLVSYSPWGQKELDMTEWLRTQTHSINIYFYTQMSRK